MMYGFGYGLGGWMIAMMSVTMLAFWALAGLGIAALVRYLRPGSNRPPTHARTAAEETLAHRYARGEIDEATYRHDLAVLRGTTPS